MKSIRQIGKVSACLFFVLGMAIYSFQAGTAWGQVSYTADIQPLFTTNGAWFDRNLGKSMEDDFTFWACGGCHAGDDETPPEECPPECHLMDLNTRAGMLNGADGGTVPILGEPAVGSTDFDWSSSTLRKRLRNNRMPPQFPFRMDESNRNGPDLYLNRDPVPAGYTAMNIPGIFKILLNDATQELAYADEAGGSRGNAVGLIGAWVDDGAGRGLRKARMATYNGINVRWRDVKAFFTKPNTWFNGSLACTYCHYCTDEPPCYHAMDLSSPEGLMNGADGGSAPILGETSVGDTDYNWASSVLRQRLRNNRMPPDAPFVLDESNRNGPTLTHPVTGLPVSAVGLIGEWVDAGCPDN